MHTPGHHITLHAQRLAAQIRGDSARALAASGIDQVGRLRPPSIPPYLRGIVRVQALQHARIQRVKLLVDEKSSRIEQLAAQGRAAEAAVLLRKLRADIHTWCRADLAEARPHADAALRRLEPLREQLVESESQGAAIERPRS